MNALGTKLRPCSTSDQEQHDSGTTGHAASFEKSRPYSDNSITWRDSGATGWRVRCGIMVRDKSVTAHNEINRTLWEFDVFKHKGGSCVKD